MAGLSEDRFCFVHAADLHLDTPFSGIHAVAPDVPHALREASLDTFDAIVELALQRRAAFVLIAGDVYDGADRGLRAQLRFQTGLGRLSDANIASFIVHGNHDPVEFGWSAISNWPRHTTVFGSTGVEIVPVVRDGRQIATVQGRSFAMPNTTENLALGFARPQSPGIHVGLLHCNVGGSGSDHSNYSPCSLDDLRASHLDYFALGHIHQRAVLARGDGHGEPWVVYPGNSQARSPKPSERGAKGAMVVEVRDGAVGEVEFVACDRVRFDEIAVDIADIGDLSELGDALSELGLQALDACDGRSLIVRARVLGRGALHHELARPGSHTDVLRHLRDGQSERSPFLWWDAIADDTAPDLDLEFIAGRGDFSADLLAIARQLINDPGELDELRGELLSALPRSLTRAGSEAIAGDSLRAAVEAGLLQAIDALEIAPS